MRHDRYKMHGCQTYALCDTNSQLQLKDADKPKETSVVDFVPPPSNNHNSLYDDIDNWSDETVLSKGNAQIDPAQSFPDPNDVEEPVFNDQSRDINAPPTPLYKRAEYEHGIHLTNRRYKYKIKTEPTKAEKAKQKTERVDMIAEDKHSKKREKIDKRNPERTEVLRPLSHYLELHASPPKATKSTSIPCYFWFFIIVFSIVVNIDNWFVLFLIIIDINYFRFRSFLDNHFLFTTTLFRFRHDHIDTRWQGCRQEVNRLGHGILVLCYHLDPLRLQYLDNGTVSSSRFEHSDTTLGNKTQPFAQCQRDLLRRFK